MMGPRLTDAGFFDALDLSRTDMAGVKAAVEERDWAGARRLAKPARSRNWIFDRRACRAVAHGHFSESVRPHAQIYARGLGAIAQSFGGHFDDGGKAGIHSQTRHASRGIDTKKGQRHCLRPNV